MQKLSRDSLYPVLHLNPKTRKAAIHREDRLLSSNYSHFLNFYTTNTDHLKKTAFKKAKLTDLVKFRNGHYSGLSRWLHLTVKTHPVDSVWKRSNTTNTSSLDSQPPQLPFFHEIGAFYENSGVLHSHL